MYDNKVDVWSVGMIVVQIIASRSEGDLSSFYYTKQQSNWLDKLEAVLKQFGMPAGINDIVRRACQNNPRLRFGMSQLCEMPSYLAIAIVFSEHAEPGHLDAAMKLIKTDANAVLLLADAVRTGLDSANPMFQEHARVARLKAKDCGVALVGLPEDEPKDRAALMSMIASSQLAPTYNINMWKRKNSAPLPDAISNMAQAVVDAKLVEKGVFALVVKGEYLLRVDARPMWVNKNGVEEQIEIMQGRSTLRPEKFNTAAHSNVCFWRSRGDRHEKLDDETSRLISLFQHNIRFTKGFQDMVGLVTDKYMINFELETIVQGEDVPFKFAPRAK